MIESLWPLIVGIWGILQVTWGGLGASLDLGARPYLDAVLFRWGGDIAFKITYIVVGGPYGKYSILGHKTQF